MEVANSSSCGKAWALTAARQPLSRHEKAELGHCPNCALTMPRHPPPWPGARSRAPARRATASSTRRGARPTARPAPVRAGATWRAAAPASRGGGSLSAQALALRAPKSCLMRGLDYGGRKHGELPLRAQVEPQLALRSIHAILEPRAPTRLSGTPPYTLATLPGHLPQALRVWLW